MSNRTSSRAGQDPYLREGFWDEPINQFWERSDLYNKEKYQEHFKLLKHGKDEPTKHPK